MGVTYSRSFADLSGRIRARAEEMKRKVEALDGKKVVVGIPADAKYPNGKSVAEVAELVSYGIRDDGSPANKGPRRFMTVAQEENGEKWNRMLKEGVRQALRAGGRTNLKPVLERVGDVMRDDIKKTMQEMGILKTGKMMDSIEVLEAG